ncbi:malonyl-CoA decarboxylase [Ottowia sp.]|uniref:malonyl-CoA decarboxylase n=1 Tax=Ottowia sp. TaxID=1898956 RepID=UPI002B8CD3C6|nr:malonyl-CoA decarboxylase [Ottowia sp.]
MNTEANTDATRVTSMRQRLGAMLERGVDAIGPWGSRRILRELQHVLDPSVSEVEGGRRAAAFAQWYAGATPEQRSECWVLMSEHFAPDVAAIESAHAAYEAVRGTDDEARAEVQLRRAFTAPRTRLLQRFSAYSGGVHFLVDLRAELLPHLKKDKRLIALDGELQELFSTWFDVGFLELRRISWDSPAALIEKLIRYEAVHDIRSWQDAKNRLDEDRRCYSFFHPRMPGEPLIFVEVALLREMAGGIVPLLDEEAAPADLDKASCAIFYSISNTQSGLKGVSFGDELIKRVVEVLQGEFPRLKLFATLSPIPGFRAWLAKNLDARLQAMPGRARAELARELDVADLTPADLSAALEGVAQWPEKSARARWLLAAGAHYLARASTDGGRPLDAVARFHLGNGARIERINWLGDPSPKGLRQSHGLMVNYLYDLKRLDRHRRELAQGTVPVAGAVQSLLD